MELDNAKIDEETASYNSFSNFTGRVYGNIKSCGVNAKIILELEIRNGFFALT